MSVPAVMIGHVNDRSDAVMMDGWMDGWSAIEVQLQPIIWISRQQMATNNLSFVITLLLNYNKL